MNDVLYDDMTVFRWGIYNQGGRLESIHWAKMDAVKLCEETNKLWGPTINDRFVVKELPKPVHYEIIKKIVEVKIY